MSWIAFGCASTTIYTLPDIGIINNCTCLTLSCDLSCPETFSTHYIRTGQVQKPNAKVARAPSFTTQSDRAYGDRGCTYAHLDESLEMLTIGLGKCALWALPWTHRKQKNLHI